MASNCSISSRSFQGFCPIRNSNNLAKHMQVHDYGDESDDRRRTARRDDRIPDPHAVGRGSDQGEAVAARPTIRLKEDERQ